jgi:predicted Zn-dependent protease with MMP-like domain
VHLPREEFERLVAEAIEGLPAEFSERLENVQFIVEDYPRPEHFGDRQIEPGVVVLGMYQGVPLTRRSVFGTHLMPDQIIIFQRSVERVCDTAAQIVDNVRRTVLHEIGHHFGIPEDRLRELGC